MYPEFIAIYAGLAVLIVLAVVIIILQAKILQGESVGRKPSARVPSKNPAGAIVFCKNCATQYSSAARCCPKCGTPR